MLPAFLCLAHIFYALLLRLRASESLCPLHAVPLNIKFMYSASNVAFPMTTNWMVARDDDNQTNIAVVAWLAWARHWVGNLLHLSAIDAQCEHETTTSK